MPNIIFNELPLLIGSILNGGVASCKVNLLGAQTSSNTTCQICFKN